MKIVGVEAKTLALYGALGVGLYFFITKLLPDLVKGLAKGAGDTAKAAVGGTAEAAGKTAGSVAMAAPKAIDSFLEELGFDPQPLERAGANIGSGLYSATSLFSPTPGGSSIDYIVNFPDGTRHAIPGNVVDAKGRFKYSGTMYQIKDDSRGAHYATLM